MDKATLAVITGRLAIGAGETDLRCEGTRHRLRPVLDGQPVDRDDADSSAAWFELPLLECAACGAVYDVRGLDHRNVVALPATTVGDARARSNALTPRAHRLSAHADMCARIDIEVAMSESQWAQFVSTPNSGSGTPCTIQHIDQQRMPCVPFAPRMEVSHAEAADAGARLFKDALAALEAHKNAEGAKAKRQTLSSLEHVLRNAGSNVGFVAKALTEHAETVTEKAKADVHAMIDARARQLGIDPVAALEATPTSPAGRAALGATAGEVDLDA